jgi:uncharacterized membrane protein YfcA
LTTLLATLAVTLGAAMQAAIGFGLNLFVVPVLAFLDPVFVPVPILFVSLLLSAAASYRLRTAIEWPRLGASIGGLLVGTLLAAALLTVFPASVMPRLLGAIVVLAVLTSAVGLSVRLTWVSLLAAGCVAGVMGTLAGLHGPPMALLYQQESGTRVRAALLPFLVAANGISLLALAVIGVVHRGHLRSTLILLPGVAVGFLVGPLLSRVLDAGHLRTAILVFSAASGLILLVRG